MLLVLPGSARAQWNDDADRCARETANFDLKIQYCSRAIQSGELSQRELALTFSNRGNVYYRKGQYDRAIKDYNQAIRLAPDYAPGYNGRAWSRYLLGQNAEALSDVDKALSLSPNFSSAIEARAHILAALRRPQEALTEFERAMQMEGYLWVRDFQEALKKHGYYSGPLDGTYSAATSQALSACLRAGCRLMK